MMMGFRQVDFDDLAGCVKVLRFRIPRASRKNNPKTVLKPLSAQNLLT
jgi:hypothetical protein